jgi:hypothetical protein
VRGLAQPKAFAKREDPLYNAIQKQIEQLVSKGEVPALSVAVARDGKIMWPLNVGGFEGNHYKFGGENSWVLN